MAAGPEFPAFLKLHYAHDEGASSAFANDVDGMLSTAERKFRTFSTEASRLLDTAISGRRTGLGSLDLGVGNLQAAASAQQARAAAAREIASATALAAKEEGDYSRQTRLAVAATSALAIQEERAAAQALAHAAAAQQVQERLSRQASATQLVINAAGGSSLAMGRAGDSTRALRFASMQSGQQLQDIAVSLYGGQRAATVFAQQLPQLAFALSGVEGAAGSMAARVGTFARFMSSGFGSLVGVGLGAVIGLGVEMLVTGDKSDKTKDKIRDLSDILRDAAASWDEVTAAVARYNKEQTTAGRTALEQAGGVAGDFSTKLDAASKRLAELSKLYTQAVGRADASAIDQKTGQIKPDYHGQAGLQYRTEIDKIRAGLPELIQGAQAARAAIAQERAKLQTDSSHAITERFKYEREQAKASIQDTRALTAELAKLDKQETAARKAAEAVTKGSRTTGTTAMFGSPVAGGSITGRFGESRPGHMHGGVDIAVPVGTTVRAVVDGIITAAGKRGDYGNMVEVDSGGAKTRDGHLSRIIVALGERVAKGDIIGYSGGARGSEGAGDSTGPHVHHEVRVGNRAVNPIGRYAVDEGATEDRGQKMADAAQKHADQIAEAFHRAQQSTKEFGDRSAESIARITSQFDAQPRAIDQAATATRQLDSVITALQDDLVNNAALTDEQRQQFSAMWQEAEAARGAITEALTRPLEEARQASDRRYAIDQLILSGHDQEAAALGAIWQLEDRLGSEEELRAKAAKLVAEGRTDEAAILQRLLAMYPGLKREAADQARIEVQRTEEKRRQLELQGHYLDASRSVKQELGAILAGQGSFKNIRQTFQQLSGQVLGEKLFGQGFRDLDKWIKQQSGITDSVDFLGSETKRAGTAAGDFADVMAGVTARLGSPAAGGGLAAGDPLAVAFDAAFSAGKKAANDNTELDSNGQYRPIVVTAAPKPGTLTALSPSDFAHMLAKTLTRPFAEGLSSIFGPRAAATIRGLAEPAGVGALIGSLFGGRHSSLIGGAIGAGAKLIAGKSPGFSNTLSGIENNLGPISLGIQANQALNSLFGNDDRVGGKFLHTILGPVASLFFKKKSGSSTINSLDGDLKYSGSGDYRSGVLSGGSSVQSSLARVIDTLHATAGAFSVSVGQRGKDYTVDPSGRGRTKGSGVLKFASAEAAAQAALLDAIRDGAVAGISAGAQRLLQAGKDLEKQLQKALDFQSVFDRLRALEDPVGAALDTLNREFERLKGVFAEAGASTEDYAKLEKLYGLDRAKAIKEATDQLTGSLRGLYDELTVGNDALSLRDRETAALGKYNPLADRVKAGDSSAFADFTDAARSLLGIERQLNGSQPGFFAISDSITLLTKGTLDSQQALINAATGSDSPFAKGAMPADNQNVVTAIGEQTTALIDALGGQLRAVNENLGTLIITRPTGGQPLERVANSANYY